LITEKKEGVDALLRVLENPLGYGFIQNWNEKWTLGHQSSRIDLADPKQFAALSRSHW